MQNRTSVFSSQTVWKNQEKVNQDLFFLAEQEVKRIEREEKNLLKYKPLLKLYDQAEIINDLV